MPATRFEDLPNELWLELFIYFTWAELDSTWLHWNLTSRIRTLARAAQTRVAFTLPPTSSQTHAQYAHYFENEHARTASRITSLVLDDSILASEIVSRWLHHRHSFFPRLRRCTIHFDRIGRDARAHIVQLLQQHAPTLRRCLFYVKSEAVHNQLWRNLIRQRISLHTMQLIVTGGRGILHTPNDWTCVIVRVRRSGFVLDDEAYALPDSWTDFARTLPQPLVFPNTVRLRLSLQHSCDLLWLLNGDTLPRLEHLHVTQEKWPTTSCGRARPQYLPLRAKDFAGRRGGCEHLRTLHLRQVPMDVVLILATHLESIRRLQSLVLIGCSVEDRVALRAFQGCVANDFPRLRRLHFEFALPAETTLEAIDLNWPRLDHDAVHSHVGPVLILYTSPSPLHHQRHLYNHVREPTSTSNEPIEHLQWTVDCDPCSLDTTLAHLKPVHSLQLYADIHEISSSSLAWSVVLPRLHSIELNCDWNPVTGPLRYSRSATPPAHRCVLLEQLRRCAPALECLTLWWHDVQLLLTQSTVPWSSVRELNIRLETGKGNAPSASLIAQLPTDAAFPQLRYLAFRSRRFGLHPAEVLAKWIVSWLDGLVSASSRFTILHLNRCCPSYRSRLSRAARDTLVALLDKHMSSNYPQRTPTKIIIDSNEEITIWL